MSQPIQECALCGRHVTVVPFGRGFPPDVAERKLRRLCKASGCACEPQYRTGLNLTGLTVERWEGER